MAKLKQLLFVDFETYYDSEYSLRVMSPPEYILDPRYETLLMAAFDVRWDAPRIVLPESIPAFLAKYPVEETICVSHNALFDAAILAWRYNWVAGRTVDTLGMVRALRSYKRNSLGAVAKELFGADTKGDLLYKVRGMHAQDIKSAGLWPDFLTYAMNDVRLCAQIYARLIDEFPPEERKIMDLVLRAAVQPILQADVPMLELHLRDLKARKAKLLVDCGYDKASLMSTAQFQKILESLGVEIEIKMSATGNWIPQFSKTDPFMADLLEYNKSPDDIVNYQVQTLASARLSQKSTIEETRAERFLNIAKLPWGGDRGTLSHSLLPVPLRYGGALTHRLSGEWSMNMQNLPRDRVKSRLREALVAPEGFKLITADLSQIEARIVAVLCEQGDLIRAFEDGEDVYAMFATHVFHRVITKKDNPHERFIGKTAILGLGYGCGPDKFFRMVTTQAWQNNIPLEGIFNEEIAAQTVQTYRGYYANIPKAWRKLDFNLESYLNNANDTQKTSWGPVTFMSHRIQLPNGLFLRYPNIDESKLYGAKLLENITQALARIVVMQAAVRLASQGLRFVAQAHDELVFVVPDGKVEESKKIITEEMIRQPKWMPNLPLAVEIGVGQNYGECK